MRFHVHKRRSAPTVIIVALIDVLIVLLIFLMVTTTFKQQQALKLALPESSEAQKSGAGDNQSVTVSIDPNGVYYLEKSPRTYEQIEEELRNAAAKNPAVILAINADEKAPWGKIVKLKDAAAAAGVKSLVALTKENAKP